MKTDELVALRPDLLTSRRLDNWCHRGVFGDDKAFPGRGKGRDFDDEEVEIAVVLGTVASTLESWSGGRGGSVDLYRSIAAHMRAGGTDITVQLAPGINFFVDTKEIL